MLLYQDGCILPRRPYFGLYSHLATWTHTLCSSSLLQSVSWYSLSVHHDDDNDDDDDVNDDDYDIDDNDDDDDIDDDD